MGNIYAFGDIHGEYLKLKALVKRLYIKEDDTLIFLGDYIDRGTRAFDTIEYLIELDLLHNCIFLKGNHEEMFLDYLTGIYEKMFVYNGGQKTIDSYAVNGYNIGRNTPLYKRKLPQSHMGFFKKLRYYYETEDFVFVHAGIADNTELRDMPIEILIWDRGYIYGPDYDYKGKVVVVGHTPSKYVSNEKYRICVDTGACFDSMGNLTCVKLPDRTFIDQSWVLEDLDDDDRNGNRGTIKEDGDIVSTIRSDFQRNCKES